MEEKAGTTKAIVIAGATGYIGKAVVEESVLRGYSTFALVRNMEKVESKQGQTRYGSLFEDAHVVECDVTNRSNLFQAMQNIQELCGNQIDTIISCLAAPSGYKRDVYAIDYKATLNFLEAGQKVGARHFILLSAFCVKKALLHLQKAKLKFEKDLQEQTIMTWSIVRPTAFFKSISRQLGKVAKGKSYLAFGDGEITQCNPIAESDLASFMIDCVEDKKRENKILNVGGRDAPMTHKQNAKIMAELTGAEPRLFLVPLCFIVIVQILLQWVALASESETLENAAEMARVVHYYASESMLTTNESEKFGRITVRDHYRKILAQGKALDERLESPSGLILSGFFSKLNKKKVM